MLSYLFNRKKTNPVVHLLSRGRKIRCESEIDSMIFLISPKYGNISGIFCLKPAGVSLSHLRQKVEPRMIKDGRWDAGVCVCNLLDLIGKPQYHLCQKLSVGLKNICSMTLKVREIKSGPGTENSHCAVMTSYRVCLSIF